MLHCNVVIPVDPQENPRNERKQGTSSFSSSIVVLVLVVVRRASLELLLILIRQVLDLLSRRARTVELARAKRYAASTTKRCDVSSNVIATRDNDEKAATATKQDAGETTLIAWEHGQL